jgi:hypothetical protein
VTNITMHIGKTKSQLSFFSFLDVIDMFTMKELEPFIQMAATMEINDMTFILIKVEDLSGELVVWVSETYRVYATPYFEGIPVPVHVIDCNNQEIGTESYPVEIESFERYCKVVQTLVAKVLRSPRM